MESEGIVKNVDGIYKNILDKFEPSAKHVIQSSKSYLKSLQSVSTASKNFIESLAKLGVNARDGGASDIGNALLDFVEVFSTIEEKHTNILKAFYVDFILPLENNIEKDTKVIHLEQKKFVQLHKQRVESFNKATSAMKKHRKKKNNAEKELKCIQTLEEEKKFLDTFCEMSVRNAKIQERRRYGFILERCVLSMAKHWSQFFSAGQASIGANIDWWMEVAKTREMLPSSNEMATLKRPQLDSRGNSSRQRQQQPHSNAYDDYGSVTQSYIRKSQSHHGSFLEVEPDIPYPSSSTRGAPRAMSQQSLASSQVAGKSSSSTKDDTTVTAIFDFIASAENQLSFNEGDKIQIIGEMTQGWQFGENLTSNQYGWFPVSYVQTESERKSKKDDNDVGRMSVGSQQDRDSTSTADKYQNFECPPMEKPPPPPTSSSAKSSVRHGSSTLNFSKQGQHHERSDNKQPKAIYSSNDSGFSNENLPPVDYSDDEMPKKVPIRDEKLQMKNAMAPQSDNEDDYSKISMKQSNSYGNLMESRAHGSNFNVDTTTMKRNKSFWRFSKSEDILMEGMALWKHRDLVPIDGEFLERPPSMIINRVEDSNATLKKQDKNKKTSTLQTKPDKALSQSAKKSEKNKNSSARNTSEKKSAIVEPSKHTDTMVSYKDPLNKYEDYDDDIYDESPKKRNDIGPTATMPKRSMQQPPPAKPVHGDRKKNFHRDTSLQETNFYEDDVFVMKTVKRKEILKQYYSSGTDTELSSSDPYDPYDCIVVDDHQLSQAQSTLRNNRNSYAAETSESLAKAYQQQRQQQQQQRASKTESLSGTLLPRTKLSKSVRSETNDFDFSDRISTTRSNKIASKEKWTNLWSE